MEHTVNLAVRRGLAVRAIETLLSRLKAMALRFNKSSTDSYLPELNLPSLSTTAPLGGIAHTIWCVRQLSSKLRLQLLSWKRNCVVWSWVLVTGPSWSRWERCLSPIPNRISRSPPEVCSSITTTDLHWRSSCSPRNENKDFRWFSKALWAGQRCLYVA